MALRFNPFTGTFDFTGSGTSDGFLPQYYIDTGDSVTIAAKREMSLSEELVVLGELINLGRIILRDENNRFRSIILGDGT